MKLTNTLCSIIRILFLVPIYSTVSFLSYIFYKHAIYFQTIRDCYEAIAIASFFTLLSNYMAPDLRSQKDYFRTLEPKPWIWPVRWFVGCTGGPTKGLLRTPRSGLTWFNVRSWTDLWFTAFDIQLTSFPRSSGSESSNTVLYESSQQSCPASPNISTNIVWNPRAQHLPTFGCVSLALFSYRKDTNSSSRLKFSSQWA